MPDYKAMYLAAMDAMERAVEVLTAAQRECEDIYVATSGDNILCWPEDAPHQQATEQN